jgi:hypothetical protein
MVVLKASSSLVQAAVLLIFAVMFAVSVATLHVPGSGWLGTFGGNKGGE